MPPAVPHADLRPPPSFRPPLRPPPPVHEAALTQPAAAQQRVTSEVMRGTLECQSMH